MALTLHRCWDERFYSWTLLKEESLLSMVHNLVRRFQGFENVLIHITNLLMVIWRGICLVDPLWPSTLHLRRQLGNEKKRQNDSTIKQLDVLLEILIATGFAGERDNRCTTQRVKNGDSYFQVVRGTSPQTHWGPSGWWPRACSRCWQLVKEKAAAAKTTVTVVAGIALIRVVAWYISGCLTCIWRRNTWMPSWRELFGMYQRRTKKKKKTLFLADSAKSCCGFQEWA